MPATVPMLWPAAQHLFQEHMNTIDRELGRPPLYQWGREVDAEDTQQTTACGRGHHWVVPVVVGAAPDEDTWVVQGEPGERVP